MVTRNLDGSAVKLSCQNQILICLNQSTSCKQRTNPRQEPDDQDSSGDGTIWAGGNIWPEDAMAEVVLQFLTAQGFVLTKLPLTAKLSHLYPLLFASVFKVNEKNQTYYTDLREMV